MAWPSRGPGRDRDRLLSEGTAGGSMARPLPAPQGALVSELHPAQLRAGRRRVQGPSGAPGLCGAMAPRGQTRGRYGPIAPGPGAEASRRHLALCSVLGSALRARSPARRQPRLLRPVPPLPAPRPARLSAPPPSSSVRASGGQPPKEGGPLPAHAEPRSRRGGGAGTRLSLERPLWPRSARDLRS